MRRFAVVTALLAAACSASHESQTSPQGAAPGGGESAKPGGLELEPPPANGFQIVLPVVPGVPPSASQEWCTWTDHILETDIDLKATKAFQTKVGHHVVLFYTHQPQPAGTTRICTDDDMASFRFASASGGEGGSETPLPGDLVVHIPKGAQLVANHHYLNPGVTAVDGQSAINVRLADPGSKTRRSGAIAMLDTSMRAPPGRSTFDVRCTPKNDLAFWQLQPHMHAWGEHIVVEHTHAGVTDRLVDLDWDPSFTFHAPEVRRDPASPYVVRAGDEVHVQCTWNNTTGKDLTFGLEMCVAFGQTVDDAGLGNLACYGGQWGPF